MIRSYLKYWLTSRSVKDCSSAFVKDLYEDVFSKDIVLKDQQIKALSDELRQNRNIIEVTDLGAGSKKTKSKFRRISSIYKSASISVNNGRVLNSLIKKFSSETILELGTSLGLGTSYLALDNTYSKVFSIEGCPQISSLASMNINKLGLENVKLYQGEFSTQLTRVLKDSGKPDFVYVDGNHTYDATIKYYNLFCANATESAILVFDDIHWSMGMENAWQEIVADDKARVTLDFFRMGIVFLDPKLGKEHLVLRF